MNIREYCYYKKYEERKSNSMMYEFKLFPFGFTYTDGMNGDFKEIEISFFDTVRIAFGLTNPF